VSRADTIREMFKHAVEYWGIPGKPRQVRLISGYGLGQINPWYLRKHGYKWDEPVPVIALTQKGAVVRLPSGVECHIVARDVA